MEALDLRFSNFEIIGFAVIAFVLFLILKGLAKGLPFIIRNTDRKKQFSKYFSLLEVFVWILYTIFVIQQLSDSNQLYSFGLFLLLMIAGFWMLWFYIKNYISGGVFKLNARFEINDTVQIDEYQGKIVGMGNHRLELESENGEIIYIPYSKLSDAVIIKLHPGEMVLSHSFTMSTQTNKSIADTIEEIRFAILSLPYASLKKTPQIKLFHEDQNNYVFELVVYTLEKEYFFKIEQEIRKKFEVSE
jgi:hypothetical protein